MKEFYYLHGIGKNNKTDKICNDLNKQFNGKIKFTPIPWFSIFDNVQIEFLKTYKEYDFKIFNGSIKKFVIYFGGDIIVYENLKKEIFKLINKTIDKTKEINFLTHSLGGVIISDFLYNNPDIKVKNLITTGNPLALYSLRYGINNFTKTINNTEKWVNVWNKYDSLSFPLKCLNQQYSDIVTEDIDLKKGNLIERIFKISHFSYLKNKNLFKIINKLL
jgi:hypothetical protein